MGEETRPCELCGSTRAAPLVTAYDRLQAREEDYRYFRCACCGLVSLHPLPKPQEIPGFYPENYAPHMGSSRRKPDKLFNRLAVRYLYGVDRASRPSLLRACLRAFSGRIMRGTREPHGANRLLDVGCGSGSLLERYRRLGWEVRGIEVSARACAVCREKGLEVHQGTIHEAPFPKRAFDMILLSHLIEHLLDPIRVLREVAEFLAPGGRIIVTTPNVRGIGFAIYGSCWYPLEAPRHIFLFDPHTVRLLGERAGLTPRKLMTRSSPGMLCKSRHYLVTQGREIPKGLAERRAILEASARSRKPYRAFRKLAAPLTLVSSLFDRGDILEVEFSAGTAR